jgi:hypothetical protein
MGIRNAPDLSYCAGIGASGKAVGKESDAADGIREEIREKLEELSRAGQQIAAMIPPGMFFLYRHRLQRTEHGY